MNAPTIERSFPLRWPEGRPRTSQHEAARWREGGRPLTMTIAERRLREQVAMMTRPGRNWRVTSQMLSTNIRHTASGARDRNVSRRDPLDPGVAFFFDLDGRPHVLACDRWDTVQDNIAAIAAHIDALRGQERWGVADLRQAFAGHVALPSPEPWWVVLGVDRQATRAQIETAYRAAAKDAHPDTGGDRAAWDRLAEARSAGLAGAS